MFLFGSYIIYIYLYTIIIKQNTMETLKAQIEELKNGRTLKEIKSTDIKLYYRIKSLSSKLSELRAQSNGNYITKEHLSEYRNLIIWVLQNKVNYNGYLNLKNAMSILLNRIEKNNITFKTKKSIKNIILKQTIYAGLEDVENNIRTSNGIDITVGYSENAILSDFQQFRLNNL